MASNIIGNVLTTTADASSEEENCTSQHEGKVYQIEGAHSSKVDETPIDHEDIALTEGEEGTQGDAVRKKDHVILND